MRQFQTPAASAQLSERRPACLRSGRRLVAVEAVYLLFVLTLAWTGLNHEPAGAPYVTLIIALASAGAVSFLAVTFMAVDPSRSRLVVPPLLILAFGAVYPVLH
ncbi:hypothetical protein ORIO_22495 (plasmid) [Cereibacter azotoformans]|uniref:hypothetical protein n=1 Tax=Cereibacter azotoformans TaxID=43057 RepID=UPI001EEB822A|nr:hypothetical protein [Cereibacter azotoformans]ULB12306.1 hypothetical protein ORIO_21175 [Cereibacter azotoformans]ULB12545.1 hypothetical protein ORIO_22495 [Cereibacter azotoformans]